MGSDSKLGSAAGASAATVCCMCGDHGLLPELFRCAACSSRSQHTYCTDRYPKAEAYGTCNWCLRAGQGGSGGVATPTPARSTIKAPVRPPVAHCSDDGQASSTDGRSMPLSGQVVARGEFAAQLNKPIKKQEQQRRRLLLRRSASDLGGGVRAKRAAGPPSPGVARGRPRVRRYKLLEEVISS